MESKKKKYIIIAIICTLSILCIYIVYFISNIDKFNKKNAVFEFYAQELFHAQELEFNEEIKPAYYLGIDKYRNLYVRGSRKSKLLTDLWVVNELRPYLYVGEENMTLDDYIENPEYELQVKLSKEEYDEIMSLMDGVEKDWKRSDASQERIFKDSVVASRYVYVHFFKYNNKYYTFSNFVCVNHELGGDYETKGEIATNNIIKVRGIIDKYIDSSIDPKQFNYSDWEFWIGDDYEGKYTIPEEFLEMMEKNKK